MNNWQDEFMAEYRRLELLQEAEQIRLERLALRSRVDRPGLFERTMCRFANWMISTGKQLRRRYTRSSPVDTRSSPADEIPAVPCSQPPTGSFAHQ
jgi:hypothetical protein